MPPLEALSSQRHAGLYWQGFTDYHFAAERTLVPLVAAELPRALGALPLAFACERERWLLVAVLGTQPQQNAFVGAQGQWLAGYVPAYLRTQPFVLVQSSEEAYTVALERDSACVGNATNGGQPLFTGDGHPAEETQQILAFLRRLAHQRAATDAACQALNAAGVLTPWPFHNVESDRPEQRPQGLYRVCESRLKQLPDHVLSSLCHQGALSIAYAQLLNQSAAHELFPSSPVESLKATGNDSPSLGDVAALFDNDDDMRFNFEDVSLIHISEPTRPY
mgnify:CR=1 FL=1